MDTNQRVLFQQCECCYLKQAQSPRLRLTSVNSEEPTSSLPSSKPEVEIRPKMTLGGGGGGMQTKQKNPQALFTKVTAVRFTC